MRRKSERTSKKGKNSPEKKEKTDKPKRGRPTRRNKQSASSDYESADDEPQEEGQVELPPVPEKVSPVKVDIPVKEQTEEQVWQVKTAESSGGEIQKLKICLTRPPSTPERPDKSPRGRRKLSRTISSSDTPGFDLDERRKTRHLSRRLTKDSKEDSGKPLSQTDSQEEPEFEVVQQIPEEADESTEDDKEYSKKSSMSQDEVPMSTTNEDGKSHDVQGSDVIQAQGSEVIQAQESVETVSTSKVDESAPQADTTGVEENKQEHSDRESKSPEKDVEQSQQCTSITESEFPQVSSEFREKSPGNQVKQDNEKPEDSKLKSDSISKEQEKDDKPAPKESESVEEPLEPVLELTTPIDELPELEKIPEKKQHSPIKIREQKESTSDQEHERSPRRKRTDSEKNVSNNVDHLEQAVTQEELDNFTPIPIIITRKRRWGRSSKSNKSNVSISTDILKDIIPDVMPAALEEVMEDKKQKKIEKKVIERIERPVLPKIVIDNTNQNHFEDKDRNLEPLKPKDPPLSHRKISIVKDGDSIINRPPSPPRHKSSSVLYITNLVRPFTLPQLKNLLQRTGRIVEDGFWIDRIKSKCYVHYETEDQAVETRHALHGVTWPVSNPKALQVDFSSPEAIVKARAAEENSTAPVSNIPGTVEDWLREQDAKRERQVVEEKPWERRTSVREWDVGKGDKPKDILKRDDKPLEKRRHNRTPERSPEPARKFKKKEEEAPAKLLDDLFRKTKATPCIYWLPLSAETVSNTPIAIKEEQRRQHMAEHERRLQELKRARRH